LPGYTEVCQDIVITAAPLHNAIYLRYEFSLNTFWSDLRQFWSDNHNFHLFDSWKKIPVEWEDRRIHILQAMG